MFIVSILKAAYSWILLWYQIWLSLPFNWNVRLFAFIVAVDVVRVKSLILLFIFLLFLSVLFLLSFCASFLINWLLRELFFYSLGYVRVSAISRWHCSSRPQSLVPLSLRTWHCYGGITGEILKALFNFIYLFLRYLFQIW